MSQSLKRIIKSAQANRARLNVTPKLDQWLNANDGELTLSPKNAALLTKLLQTRPRVRSGSFSASSRGACERAQVFGFIGVPGRKIVDSVEKMRFIDGKMKHLTFQMMGLEAGIFKHIEAPIKLPHYKVIGSIDAAEPDDFGVELKTTQAFQYYVDNGPSLAHHLQVETYFEGRPDLDEFSIVYWDTRSREWKEFVFTRQKQYRTLAIAELERLNEAVDNRKLPPILQECRNGKGQTFRSCSYCHVCLGTKEYTEAEVLVQAIGSPSALSRRRRSADNQGDDGGTRRVQRRVVRKKRVPD